MRSTWGRRIVAALLVATLLPVSIAPAGAATPHAASLSYAAWLRTQLDGSATPAVEAALDAAVAAYPASIDAFLSAFAEAYAAAPDGGPLADVFEAPADLTAEGLLSFLRSRFDRLGAEAYSRVTWLAPAPATPAGGPERAKALLVVPARLFAAATVRTVGEADAPVVVLPVRVRTAARPNGP